MALVAFVFKALPAYSVKGMNSTILLTKHVRNNRISVLMKITQNTLDCKMMARIITTAPKFRI